MVEFYTFTKKLITMKLQTMLLAIGLMFGGASCSNKSERADPRPVSADSFASDSGSSSDGISSLKELQAIVPNLVKVETAPWMYEGSYKNMYLGTFENDTKEEVTVLVFTFDNPEDRAAFINNPQLVNSEGDVFREPGESGCDQKAVSNNVRGVLSITCRANGDNCKTKYIKGKPYWVLCPPWFGDEA